MKVNRTVAIVLSVVMVLSLLSINAFATEAPLSMTRATTDLFYTPAMTAGKWWSGYDDNCIYNLACNKDSLTGSDIDMYIYYSQVGMPDTFVTDSTRTCEVEVKEYDSTVFNKNETAFTKTGTFGIDRNGLYNITGWSSKSDINTSVIESNDILELYIRVYIQTKNGDTGTSIPENLIYYQFVTTY